MKNSILKQAAHKISSAPNMLCVESIIRDTAMQITGNWNLALIKISLQKNGRAVEFSSIKASRLANYEKRKNQIARILIQFVPARLSTRIMYRQLVNEIN